MRDIFSLLIPISLAAVALALGFGLFNLVRGGDENRSRSNKLMRLRVFTQFLAILVLCAAFYWRTRGH